MCHNMEDAATSLYNSSQGIDTIAEVSAAGAGQSLEIDREIVLAEADGGPHGFDASGCDAVEAGFSNLGDQSVSAQFSDQTGGLVGSASGLPVIRGRGVEQLGLEVAVAEAGDGELAGEHGDEQQD